MSKSVLTRDNYVYGIVLGILLPAAFYLFLWLMDLGVLALFDRHMLEKQSYLYLLSVAVNLFAIKYYFVNLKYDKTGRGVLVVTFVLAILYFVLT